MTTPTLLGHLNQTQLARRWCLSPRTLERWRWLKQGPDYVKVGGRVLYRLNDIESFEAANLRHLVSETPGRDFGRGGRR